MKPRSPAPLLAYILKYLWHRPNPALLRYREKLRRYEKYLEASLPGEFSAIVTRPLAYIIIAFVLGRIFTAVAAVAVISLWVFAPVDGIPSGHSLETWVDASWLLWLLIPCYLSWSFLGWYNDTRSYTLFSEFESTYGDDDLAAAPSQRHRRQNNEPN